MFPLPDTFQPLLSWYEALDLDGDGTVSPQELLQSLDKNRDGQISVDDMAELLNKMR